MNSETPDQGWGWPDIVRGVGQINTKWVRTFPKETTSLTDHKGK